MKTVDIRTELRKFADKHPSRSAAARSLGLSPQRFSDMLAGRRSISQAILDQIGVERQVNVTYRKKRKK